MKRNLKNNERKPERGERTFVSVNSVTSVLNIRTLTLLFLFVACNGSETAHEHDTYTCPMHPTVVSDRPGSCPVCGMDLVRKARAGEEVEITEEMAKLIQSPNERVVSSIKTIKGQYKTNPVFVDAPGVVTYDTRGINTISARVAGRLEQVYMKYTFQTVSKGQKIAEIYSPELITAQRQLLFLLDNDPENHSLIDAAKRKLALLGLSQNQITSLVSRRVASNTVSVYSPYSGYLITGQLPTSGTRSTSAPANQAGGMTDNMGAASATVTTPATTGSSASQSLKRAGDYVSVGEPLFTVVRANALLIELELPGAYSNDIHEGSPVELDLGKERNDVGRVDLVQPFIAQGQNFLKVRVYPNNSDNLQIGQLVNGRISLKDTEGLWVPNEAVLDMGIQKIVFVKDTDFLKPREVTTGMAADGMVQIKSGLASSEDIAANARYLVDSESFIKLPNR